MNKRIILLCAALISATPVLHVAASAESMYCDIKGIVEDTLTGTSDHERLNNVCTALNKVKSWKIHSQNNIIDKHSTISSATKELTMISGCVAVCATGLSGYACYINQPELTIIAGIYATMMAGFALINNSEKAIAVYYNKKKIIELNAVIVKLQTMEKELTDKIYGIK